MKNFRREYLFFAIVALFWFSQYVYMPFFSPYMISIGISVSVVGMVVGAYGFTQMALRIPLSILGSVSISHKIIIGGGLVVVFFSCILPIFSESWVIFLLTRSFAGVAAATWVSYSAYLLEGAGSAANRRMGLLMTACGIGTCFAQIVGMFLYDHVGMRTIFGLGAGTSMASVILLFCIPFKKREALDERQGFTRKSLSTVLKNRHLWLCSILMSLAWWLIFSTNYSFTGVFAQEELGADSLLLGLIAIVCQLASIFVSALIGKFGAHTLPERGILTAGFLIFAVYCSAMTFCGPISLVVVQALCGAACCVCNVILTGSAGRELDDSQKLLAMGVFQTIYSIGVIAGPAITGIVIQHTDGKFGVAFYLLAGTALIGAVMSHTCYKSLPNAFAIGSSS
jgi:predicted MFS family arabinose efflux permease